MTQYARPDTDLAAGNWTPSTGATLYGCIDEAVTDDGDYIHLTNSTSSTAQIRLSDVTDPVSASNHVITIRGYRTGTVVFAVQLYQGATAIMATPTLVSLDESVGVKTVELTTAQANAITDYTDLILYVAGTANNATRHIYVMQLYFGVPDAGAAAAGVPRHADYYARLRNG